MQDKEKALRSYIRKAIKIVKERKKRKKITEEHKLRSIVRNMILETSKVPKWGTYGKNNLDLMLLNSNILNALETGYKSLETTRRQRDSFKTHVLHNVKKTLNLERAKEIEGDQSIELTEDEDINITVGGGEELMGLSPDEEKVKGEDKEKEEFKIEGEDFSGVNEAYDAFKVMRPILLTFWKKMDLDEDRDIFYDNLVEQLSLYFDKWEGELESEPKEPAKIGGSPVEPPLPPMSGIGEPPGGLPSYE